MCTSISFYDRGLYGRNLDLEYHFGEQVVITPRAYPFTFHHSEPLTSHHAMIGMASVAQNTPLYAEAANEARALLETVRLAAIPFAPGYPLAALHWQVAGPDGSFIAEPMEDGLHFYDDVAGVLTNNPPYPYQVMNLNNYRGLSPRTPENTFAPALDLKVYGQGFGGLGMPGDVSPMSRFVRVTFCKQHAVFPDSRDGQVTQFFHLLDAVSMVRGTVITPEGRCDETTYSCCYDAKERVYYYKTYDSGCLHGVRLTEELAGGDALHCYPLADKPQFVWDN